MNEKIINTTDDKATKNKVFNNKSWILRSKKFFGYNIVQYNIWKIGNKKLRKNIKKQSKKAKKALIPINLTLCFFLNPPCKGEWYFAFLLENFSMTNKAKIKINR